MKRIITAMTIALVMGQPLTIVGLANTDPNVVEANEPVSLEAIDSTLEQGREELLTLIKEVEDKITNEDLLAVDFTVETWSNLTSALNIARSIANNDSSSTEDLQLAMLTLENSLENLERINWDSLILEYHNAYNALATAIKEVEKLEPAWYHEVSWSYFMQGLEIAEAALQNSIEGTTATEVKQEIYKLENAKNRFDTGFDALEFNTELIFEKLDEVVNKIQAYVNHLDSLNLEATHFTEDSWRTYIEVYESVKDVNPRPEESSALAALAYIDDLEELLNSLTVSFNELEAVESNKVNVEPGVEDETVENPNLVEEQPIEESNKEQQTEKEEVTNLPRSGQLSFLTPRVGYVAVLASLIGLFYKVRK